MTIYSFDLEFDEFILIFLWMWAVCVYCDTKMGAGLIVERATVVYYENMII